MATSCIAVALLLVFSCVEKEMTVGVKEKKFEKVRILSIAHVLKNCEAYKDKMVTISGRVSTGMAFEFVNEQPYVLDDGTGEIWVITKGVMPREGSEITVSGALSMPYQIKGRQYDIALLESGRE